MTKVVTVSQLRTLANLLLDNLEALNLSQIAIERDYYWEMSANDRYSMNKEPEDFSVGQLFDDLDNLLRVLDGSREPTRLTLTWYAALLRYIGERDL
ncbi:MAG: hypothetical protein KA401_03520 [Anaerolineae bacterium]|nr:hypothetical protein [Chloroflexota bacterium]MBP6298393.1 hypothetical protein [Anaerolineae bacterium]